MTQLKKLTPSSAASLVIIMLGTIPLVAQEPGTPATPSGVEAASAVIEAKPTLTLADVEAKLTAMEADAAAPASVKEKYQQAVDALKLSAQFAATTGQCREATASGADKATALRDQVQALPSLESAADVTSAGSAKDLQTEIDSRKAARDGLAGELAKITKELTRVKGRPVEISARLPVAQRELSETTDQLKAAEALPEADRVLLQATQLKLESELEMLKEEQSSQSVRADLLQAQQELLTRKVETETAALATLSGLLQRQLKTEAEQFAKSLPRAVPVDDQEATKLADEVQTLSAQQKELVDHPLKVTTAQKELTGRLQELTEQYESVSRELDLGGGGQAMAQILFNLDDLARWDVRQAKVPITLDQARLASFHVDDQLHAQPELEKQFSAATSAAITQLLENRREVLEKLQTQYDSLTRALGALEADKKQFIDKSREVRSFVSEQLFGFRVRSCPPLELKSFSDLPSGLRWAFTGDHWQDFTAALTGMAQRLPMASITVALVATLLLLTRRPIGTALEQTGVRTRRISTDHYAHTLAAFGWTLLLAIPIPLVTGFTAWGLEKTQLSDWMRGIAVGLWDISAITLATSLLTAICRRGGLGTAHFGWRAETVAKLRSAILGFALIYIPALLLTGCFVFGDEASSYYGSVGRISFLAAHAWMAIVFWRLFRGRDGLLAVITLDHSARPMQRWRFLWFPLLFCCPLALIVVACLGYLSTASSLSLGLLMTIAIIIGGEVLYWTALRWFMIKQRRLALEEALERRRARLEAATSDEASEKSQEVVTVAAVDEQELDLESISEQTRTLLQLGARLSALLAIIAFWSGVVPLLGVLDTILIPLLGSLSVLGLLQAVLIAVVTYNVVRNLPGLLELAVLRSTAIEAGTRNAVCTLGQYAVTALGLVLLSGVLKLDWEKFGWMAAALSVGLGFGLQEVVANFVCGIILLFEQPIRVGDVVTLEGTTGTVTKIHMRATTITNWDRQDFVVPNKSLITGTILNWTLTASVNRLVIPVGVAYGTDMERARQILLDVAADHPAVLTDPAPIASVEQLGDSAVNLMLRAYLADLGQRISTTTELLTEIQKRFAAAGIEIPFPQQDLHLRGGWERLSGAVADRAEHDEPSYGTPR